MKAFDKKTSGLWTAIDLKHWKVRVQYWFVFIVMICISAICLFPPIWLFLSSFKSMSEFLSVPPTFLPKSFDVNKILSVWKSINFSRYYANTLFMALGDLFMCIAVSGLAGYVISRLKPKGIKFVFALILWTMMMPNSVGLVPLFMTFIDFPLLHINLTNTYFPMWMMAGANSFFILLFKSFFDSIPLSYLEAARIDGCSDLGIFHKIIVPLSKPVIMVVSILSLNSSWENFFWPYLILKNQLIYTVAVKIFIMKNGGWAMDTYIVSLLLVILPPAIMFTFFQRYIIGGLTLGGIKG